MISVLAITKGATRNCGRLNDTRRSSPSAASLRSTSPETVALGGDQKMRCGHVRLEACTGCKRRVPFPRDTGKALLEQRTHYDAHRRVYWKADREG